MLFTLLNNFAVTLGVMLLYFPPLLIWISQGFLRKYQVLIDMRFSLPVGLVFTIMLSYLIPQAWFIFLFYFGLFHFTRFYSRYGSLFHISKLDSFSLSVYLCFAVSVLWEWPIQIAVAQNLDALILSGFRVLAIPLFFYKAYQLGFRFGTSWIWISVFIFLGGVGLIPVANNMLINLYRFVWAFLLLIAIPVKKRDISKGDNEKPTL
jgi:hypothetical protein